MSTILVPSEQRSNGVADTNLVVCAGESRTEQLGVCNESFVENRRHRQENFAGQVILSTELSGPMPTPCDEWTGSRPYSSTFTGNAPGGEEVGAWLRTVP